MRRGNPEQIGRALYTIMLTAVLQPATRPTKAESCPRIEAPAPAAARRRYHHGETLAILRLRHSSMSRVCGTPEEDALFLIEAGFVDIFKYDSMQLSRDPAAFPCMEPPFAILLPEQYRGERTAPRLSPHRSHADSMKSDFGEAVRDPRFI